MMEAQCAINGSRTDTQRDYTACAVSSATCVSDMYAVTDVQGQAYRLLLMRELNQQLYVVYMHREMIGYSK